MKKFLEFILIRLAVLPFMFVLMSLVFILFKLFIELCFLIERILGV
jgi:hypothetical protein